MLHELYRKARRDIVLQSRLRHAQNVLAALSQTKVESLAAVTATPEPTGLSLLTPSPAVSSLDSMRSLAAPRDPTIQAIPSPGLASPPPPSRSLPHAPSASASTPMDDGLGGDQPHGETPPRTPPPFVTFGHARSDASSVAALQARFALLMRQGALCTRMELFDDAVSHLRAASALLQGSPTLSAESPQLSVRVARSLAEAHSGANRHIEARRELER
jgi:hypothetical protein